MKYLKTLDSMRHLGHSALCKKQNENMRLILITFVGVVIGFLIGVSFPMFLANKMTLSTIILPDSTHVEATAISTPIKTQEVNDVRKDFWGCPSLIEASEEDQEEWSCEFDVKRMRKEGATGFTHMQIWVPSNPRGAERLAPGIVVPHSDLYLRRLYGNPSEDLSIKPKYLVTFTVGYNQRQNIDAAVKKFSENFTILLFHYDNRASEWDEYEWSKKAIHISARKQTKWWYAKRFLHPDVVAAYDYIFIWDEDLGVENFTAEEYIRLVRKHGLEISQPGLDPRRGPTWQMTRRREDREIHKETEERPGWCKDPHLPPCAAFVEIMAPVFSRDAWRCVWHMIQNDLVHGWGLDLALQKCVEPAHEKIGVVDAQWIVHQGTPTLGNQGQADDGKPPWQGVRERCKLEWKMFQHRFVNAEKDYNRSMGLDPSNTTSH